MCLFTGCNEKNDPWVSAVFGGGPFVTGIEESAEILKSSDFNTMIIWSVHVNENGDLVLNDVPVASFGRCIAKKPIREEWAKLKEKGSSIKRVEISVGAWGCADFENIKAMCFTAFDGGITHFDLANNYGPAAGASGSDGGIF